MIDIEHDDDHTILTLNNPPVNAICSEMLDELDDILNSLEPESRAVILTGEGKHFAAGADISEMKGMGPDEAEDFSQKGHRVFTKLENLSKPVIAAVNGFALGGGLEIALSCDFIIASEKAQFGQPEVGLGLIPGFGGTQRLPRTVGPNKAKELIFTGERISADEALNIGLVNKVVDPEKLMDKAVDTAKKISENSPLAVQYAKRSVQSGRNLRIEEALEIEAEEFKKCFETEDHEEGLEAFIEKREPEFKGK